MRKVEATKQSRTPSFRDGPQDQTSDVQLHIGESLDYGSKINLETAKTLGLTIADAARSRGD